MAPVNVAHSRLIKHTPLQPSDHTLCVPSFNCIYLPHLIQPCFCDLTFKTLTTFHLSWCDSIRCSHLPNFLLSKIPAFVWSGSWVYKPQNLAPPLRAVNTLCMRNCRKMSAMWWALELNPHSTMKLSGFGDCLSACLTSRGLKIKWTNPPILNQTP